VTEGECVGAGARPHDAKEHLLSARLAGHHDGGRGQLGGDHDRGHDGADNGGGQGVGEPGDVFETASVSAMIGSRFSVKAPGLSRIMRQVLPAALGIHPRAALMCAFGLVAARAGRRELRFDAGHVAHRTRVTSGLLSVPPKMTGCSCATRAGGAAGSIRCE